MTMFNDETTPITDPNHSILERRQRGIGQSGHTAPLSLNARIDAGEPVTEPTLATAYKAFINYHEKHLLKVGGFKGRGGGSRRTTRRNAKRRHFRRIA